MGKLVNLSGKKFGRLTVKSRSINTKYGKAQWLCKCDCGGEKIVMSSSLIIGFTSSCGCLKKESIKTRSITHGLSRTDEYIVWAGIKARCYDINSGAYYGYGGRGISMSGEWRGSFEIFLNDMGKKPSSMHSIERINNNGMYCKENCRWATKKEQARNRRTSKMIEYNGEIRCLSEWCEIFGITWEAHKIRSNKGWSLEKIFNTPLFSKQKQNKCALL